jgi:flagellar FliL protein
MRKNLLTVIILFLLIVNISLTGVLTFTLVVTNQAALALMTDVATVLRLELPMDGDSGEFVAPSVPIRDVATYNVAASEQLTIALRQGEGETSTRYMVLRVALSMDSRSRDFRNNGEGDLSAVDTMIQDIIIRAFSRYTSAEVREAEILENIKREILTDLHTLYDSTFIFGVSFLDIMY